MASVRKLGKWKPVDIDPHILSGGDFEGFVCMEELSDYELVKGAGRNEEKEENKQTEKNKKKKEKKLKMKRQDGEPDLYKNELNKGNEKKKKKKKGQVVEGNAVTVLDVEEKDATPKAKKKATDKLRVSEKRKRKGEKIDSDSLPKKKKKLSKKIDSTISVEKTSPVKTRPDMSAWKDLLVPSQVLDALADQGFSSPTPIQALSLPSAIRDRMDIVGAAETGSGKTLAFGIPLIHHILQNKEKENKNIKNHQSDTNIEDDEKTNKDRTSDDESDGDQDDDNSEKGGSQSDDAVVKSDEDSGADEAMDGDEDYDNPPEDEELEELEGNSVGCVKVINNVSFDWLETPKKPKRNGKLLGLVLTPTRELAVQVKRHLVAAAKYTDIQIAVVVGGMSQQKQERLLKKCPEIVVATPGRLWELVQEGEPHLSTIQDLKYLVIDEADRMVEKGHFQELTSLLELINSDDTKRKKRQNFIFSATLMFVHSGPQRIIKKKKQFKMTLKQKLDSLLSLVGIQEKPKIIDLTRKSQVAETLLESRINCRDDEKDLYLYYFLQQHPGRTLLFANSIDCIRRLVSIFTLLKCNPLPLHANMHQKQRLKNLERFTADDKGFLLATDVAARGLDIPNVQHVIHYQVPRTTETYVHRSGRTARATKEGLTVMLIGPGELKNYRKIINTLKKEEDLPQFPVTLELLTAVKSRLSLAREIDKTEHRASKQRHQNDWFEKAAKEMDIELDDRLLNDLGDSFNQSNQKRQLKQLRSQLDGMLQQSLKPRTFSGRYPTKTGHLVLPESATEKKSASSVLSQEKGRKLKTNLQKSTKPRRNINKKKKTKV